MGEPLKTSHEHQPASSAASRLHLRVLFLVMNALALAAVLVLVHNAISPSADSIARGTDRLLYDLYRAHAFLGWKPFFEAGSFIGGHLLGLLVPAGFGLLYAVKARRQALTLLVSTMSAWAGVTLLKLVFSAPRPRVREVTYAISGYGFPSAHAMVTLVFFGLLAFFLHQKIQRGHIFVWMSAVLIIGWVGASRVFLGSHWLSDVLAGYAFGFLWISGTLFMFSRWAGNAADISERSHA